MWTEPEADSSHLALAERISNAVYASGLEGVSLSPRFVVGLGIVGVMVAATIVQSCTEAWIVSNCKIGLTGKQLRDWCAW